MEYRKFSTLGDNISLLGFGGMRFPTDENGKIARREAKAMIDRAYKGGVNYFDTAYGYHDGESELFFGEALTEYPRDSYFLADKLPVWYVKEFADEDRLLNEQLSKTKQEYFDFYLVHAVSKEHFENFEKLGAFEHLRELQKEGKFRHLGFSFHDTPDVLEQIVERWKPDFVQIQLNYFDWKLIDAEKMYDILASRNIPAIIMEPVRGGMLHNLPKLYSDKLRAVAQGSNAAVALRWVAQLPDVMCILSGMTYMEHLEDNVKTFSSFKPLNSEELDFLAEVADQLETYPLIRCTGCQYCMPCPYGLNIPAIFKFYNDNVNAGTYVSSREQEDYARLRRNYLRSYNKTIEPDRQADHCIGCGKCARECPQHIAIPRELRRIDEYIESLKQQTL